MWPREGCDARWRAQHQQDNVQQRSPVAHMSCKWRARQHRTRNHEEPSDESCPESRAVRACRRRCGACGPRQVEVRTAPTKRIECRAGRAGHEQPEPGRERVRHADWRCASCSSARCRRTPSRSVPVQGIATRNVGVFKAVTIDGSRTYQSRNVAAQRPCSLWRSAVSVAVTSRRMMSPGSGCWQVRDGRIAFRAGAITPARSSFRHLSPLRDRSAAGLPCALGVA